MNRIGGVLIGLAIAGTMGGVFANEAGAQEDGLTEVRSAMDEGRFPQARDLLGVWWERDSDAADRRTRQEALWLRGLLTPDPEVAELDYRRLVIEFPGGPYSAGALLRLAQGAEATREPETASRYLEILLRDYPGSEYRLAAQDLLSTLSSEAAGREPEPEPDTGADVPPDPPTTVAGDSLDATADSVDTTADSLVADSLPERPAFPDAPEADRVPTDPVQAAIDRADGPLTGDFTVQLGAFSTLERAAQLVERTAEAGLEVRLVQVDGSVLFRVRLGAWPTRAQAEVAAGEPRDLGFEALVSPDRDLEHPPRPSRPSVP